MAFITSTPILSSSCNTRSASPSITTTSPTKMSVSRRDVIRTSIALSLSLIPTLTTNANAAHAANGEGLEKAFSKVLFPKSGFNVPDGAPPPTIDQSVLSTPEAKEALSTIRSYQTNISDLYSQFKVDPKTMELTATIRKLVSISDLRISLNIINEAIDESSQIESDKVVRGIIQDIGELENAAQLKPGANRTAKKMTRTGDWFDKLGKDFVQLLAFYG